MSNEDDESEQSFSDASEAAAAAAAAVEPVRRKINPFLEEPCCENRCCAKYRQRDVFYTIFSHCDRTNFHALAQELYTSELYTYAVKGQAARKRRNRNGRLSKTDRGYSFFEYRLNLTHCEKVLVCKAFFLYIEDISESVWYAARREMQSLRDLRDLNRADRHGTFYRHVCETQPNDMDDIAEIAHQPFGVAKFICRLSRNGTMRREAIEKRAQPELWRVVREGYYFRCLLKFDPEYEWNIPPLKHEPTEPHAQAVSKRKRARLRFTKDSVNCMKDGLGRVHPFIGETSIVRVMPSTVGEGSVIAALRGDVDVSEHHLQTLRALALSQGLLFFQPECTLCYAADMAKLRWNKNLHPLIALELMPTPMQHVALHWTTSFAQERLLETEMVLLDSVTRTAAPDNNVALISLGDGPSAMDIGMCETKLPQVVLWDCEIASFDLFDPCGVFVCVDSRFDSIGENSSRRMVLMDNCEYWPISLAAFFIDRHLRKIESELLEYLQTSEFEEIMQPHVPISVVIHAATCVRMSSVSGSPRDRHMIRAFFAEQVRRLLQRANAHLYRYGPWASFSLNAQFHETVIFHSASSFVPASIDRLLRTHFFERAEIGGPYDGIEELASTLRVCLPYFFISTTTAESNSDCTRGAGRELSYRQSDSAYNRAGAIRITGVTRGISDEGHLELFDRVSHPVTALVPSGRFEQIRLNCEVYSFERYKERWRSIYNVLARSSPNPPPESIEDGDAASCFISRELTSGACPCDITERKFLEAIEEEIRMEITDNAVVNAFNSAARFAETTQYTRLAVQSNDGFVARPSLKDSDDSRRISAHSKLHEEFSIRSQSLPLQINMSTLRNVARKRAKRTVVK